jgi:hypothetical protein
MCIKTFTPPALITAALCIAITAIGPNLGFNPEDISARSLRSGGAMALLCNEVDTDKINCKKGTIFTFPTFNVSKDRKGTASMVIQIKY